MGAEAYIQHQLPGRVRLRIPSMRGHAAFFTALSRQLADHPAILSVRTIPVIGSVLILHQTDFPSLAAYIDQQGFCHIVPRQPGHAQQAPAPPGTQDVGAVEPPTPPGPKPWMHVTALGFASLTVPAVHQHQYLGTALENLWNAYQAHTNHFSVWTWLLTGAGVYQLLQGHILPPALTLLFYATSARQLAQGQSQEPVG
jgi:Heavy metal associated domain 2